MGPPSKSSSIDDRQTRRRDKPKVQCRPVKGPPGYSPRVVRDVVTHTLLKPNLWMRRYGVVRLRFLVHTDVTARELDPLIFIKSVPDLLASAHLASVKFLEGRVCNLSICHCAKDRKLMCLLEGPDQETVRNALAKIELPITAILSKPN